jgi:SAM-dependent methyltransferase
VRDFDPVMPFSGLHAEQYDQWPKRGTEDATVEFLAGLAGGGPALELAIGTGRIGLPLASRGIAVTGVDLSADMVTQLRAKPGGADIPVTIGDFADVPVAGVFSLIYVVFNTFFNLLTQDDQVLCFANVAGHLTPGGVFVIEAGPPDWLYRLRDHQHVNAEYVGVGDVIFDVLRHDPLTQRIEENHVYLSADRGAHMVPIVQRYAWNAELDLMARMAGMELRERWAGWHREPYTADSRNCVHVYARKPDKR